MAHVWGNRVRETSTTTGTGQFTLDGAASGGFQAFDDVCADGDTVYYCIADPAGTKWEVGLGTWNSGDLLTRASGGVLEGSSGAGVLVSFDAGTKDVMLVVPFGSGAFALNYGADVASGATLPRPTGRVFHVTGTTDITSITSTNVEKGSVITMIFDDALTVTDGGNLKLASNFETDTDATLTLGFDGTNWYEIARSVN